VNLRVRFGILQGFEVYSADDEARSAIFELLQ
jgi:hypothetical protein